MTDSSHWHFRQGRPLPRHKTLIMGIVNLTPDSFSGGGQPLPNPAGAAERALAQLAAGADLVDLGAESSRPGATVLTPAEEIARLGDTVARIRAVSDAPLSVDTYHPETAAHALDQGADIINDITALRGGWTEADRHATAMADLAAGSGAHVILMHMPAAPAVMQAAPAYRSVVTEVRHFLLERAAWAERRGIPRGHIWLDPGFGFGKTYHHNRELLRHLDALTATGFPVLAGLSRKRMIHDALGLAVDQRLEASVALAVIAAMNGAAMVRVHDVHATARAVAMADAIHRE
ncbi:MAG: dihydropteroate synthase [Planctomycetes bacterium]|nr:dihydropteroate synthase [Planctomycetota bacterium]